MRIKPDELRDIMNYMFDLFEERNLTLKEELKRKDSEIQGLNAVVITLKDFRDETLRNQKETK